MRLNVLIGSATLALTASVLTACGGGGSSNSASGYCDELKSDKAYFDAIGGSSADVSKLGDAFARVHTLASKAPANVAGDWKTLDGAITTIESALSDAGLKPSDLAGLQSGKVPQGVDVAKLQALIPKLQSLGSSNVSDAADAIAADAKKTCGVDLGSTN
ncbi:hypothetical protein [Nocardioides cynanchi]|uniref:hypothetical protein n=1 Tax=Nocardioides cynanchi TaxID=2558918 RepID=UPI00124737D6|nr:hypothetical protein [Nocardioides cynanchi]